MCFHDKHSVISQVLRLYWTYSVHLIQTGTLSFAKLAIFTELVENILQDLSKLGSKVMGENIVDQVVTQHQLSIKTGWATCWGQPGLIFPKNCYWLQKDDQVFRTLLKNKISLPGWKKLYFCKCFIRSCEGISFTLSSYRVNRDLYIVNNVFLQQLL